MIALLPIMILFVGAMATMLISRLSPNRGAAGSFLSSVLIIAALVNLLPVFNMINQGAPAIYPVNIFNFTSYLAFDFLSLLISVSALILGLMVAIFSYRYMEDDLSQDKFYALLLIMIGAIMGLSAAGDLFTIWVFFELMCVSSYILVSFRKEKWEPLEAGFKYIIMSAAGSMLVLLGIAFVFGNTGVLDLYAIKAMSGLSVKFPLILSAVLFIAGFSVKAALVPFHTWLPDAHSQAPSGISAMLSGIVIQAGFFAMLRSVMPLYGAADIGTILIVLAVASMFVGNIMALAQDNIKRMLAYSSVAQMGYIVLGIGIGLHFLSPLGIAGGLFHIITHAGMKGLAFLVAGVVIHYAGVSNISDMKGLAKKMPLEAFCFTLAVLSLAGVPPLSGFMSKWIIYSAGIQVGGWGFFLAAAAIFNSVLSLGYYLPVVNKFYSSDISGKIAGAKKAPITVLAPIVVLAVSVVVLGIFPGLGLAFVDNAARNVFMILGVLK